MSIKSAIKNIHENKLNLMKENFNAVISKKAAEELEEMKGERVRSKKRRKKKKRVPGWIYMEERVKRKMRE